MCCLYCPQFLFSAIVLDVVKLQVVSSCSEQDIFSLVIVSYCNTYVKTD